jgi:ABC-type transport system involved in multi-copper enzyme maturation permease subunit
MSGLLASEWTKLRTVRSTIWTLGMTVFIGLAASAIAAAETRAHWATMSAANKATFHPIETSLVGLYLGGTLLLGILGILVVSSEYGTGTIRATLSAAPRRPMVLAAKVLVFGAVSLVVAEVTALAGFLLGQALLISPANHATLSSPGALRAVAGIGLFLCVVGLFALGIAVVARHTAGAIGAYVAVVLVL